MKSMLLTKLFCGLLVFLFAYTGTSKLLAVDEFRATLHHVSFIAPFSSFLAIVVPAVELLAAGLLVHPAFTRRGLVLSFVLLLVFTVYLSSLLFSGNHLPCSCGGIIQQLSWQGHLLLNSLLLLMTGVVLFRTNNSLPDHPQRLKSLLQ